MKPRKLVDRLTESVTVQRATDTPDALGGATSAWADYGTFRAEVLPTGGREALIASVPTGVQGFRITVRRSTETLGITHADRIVWRGRTLALRTAFEDPDGMRESLVAFADAGVPV